MVVATVVFTLFIFRACLKVFRPEQALKVYEDNPAQTMRAFGIMHLLMLTAAALSVAGWLP